MRFISWVDVVEYDIVMDIDEYVFDEVLAELMLAPRSYTPEDFEVYLCCMLRKCSEAGAVLTQPGDYTLCAFLIDCLGLTQAKNVGKLIASKYVASIDVALEGMLTYNLNFVFFFLLINVS